MEQVVERDLGPQLFPKEAQQEKETPLSLLEQLKESYGNDKIDRDLYDVNMYDDQTIPDNIKNIATYGIKAQGHKKH